MSLSPFYLLEVIEMLGIIPLLCLDATQESMGSIGKGGSKEICVASVFKIKPLAQHGYGAGEIADRYVGLINTFK